MSESIKRKSIKSKVAIFFVMVVLMISLMNILIIGYVLSGILTSELLSKVKIMTSSLVTMLDDAVLENDSEEMAKIIFDEKYSRNDIAYIMVIDENNNMLANTFLGDLPADIIDRDIVVDQGKSVIITELSLEKNNIYDIAISLNHKQGIIRAGFYKEHIDRSVKEIIYVLLLFMIFPIVVAFLTAIYLTKNILKPIEHLKDIVNKISEGDLDQKVEIEAGEELESLADSFNKMTEKINNSQKELVKEKDSLRETKEYLENLLGYANAPIIVWNTELKITMFNAAFEELTGYKFYEVVGKNVNMLFSETEKKEYIKNIASASVGKKWKTLEINVLRKDGSLRIVLWNSANVLNNKRNKIIATIAQGQDITERVKIEKELLKEKNKLEKYFNITGIIILTIEIDGSISYMNQKGLELLGYDLSKMSKNEWINKVVFEGDRIKTRETMGKFIKNIKEKTYFENHMIVKNGNTKNIAWRGIAILDNNGNIDSFLWFGEDVTELKKARLTIFELKEVDKMKDDFLNIVAHELKTPLTSVIGLSEIIKSKKDTLTPLQIKYVDIIYNEGIRLSHVVKRMLTITRFESRREIINFKTINLSELILSLLPNLCMLSNKVKIDVNMKEKDMEIVGDQEKISEVIINLVENAIKYGPEKQTITISVIRLEKGIVRIEIIDQGPGIPSEAKDKLFVKFSQLNPLFTRSREGSGLGLYICKLVVEGLGGEIGHRNNEGRGSTFYFTLPVGK